MADPPESKLPRMAAAEIAERSRSLERDWWLRTLLVLQAPRAVFAALRNDTADAAAARQEPMAAVVFLGGIAVVLLSSAAGHLLDDFNLDGLLIAVWAIGEGAVDGIGSYWLLGGAVYLGQRAVGGRGSYRQARHLLGYAAVPLLVWLAFVWPVRLALYGADLFRRGGDDGNASRFVFGALAGAVVVWSLALVLTGLRTVYALDWRRSLLAFAVSVAPLAALGTALLLS
jgi:hypothetical protein